MLLAGADKVGINTAAVNDPELVSAGSKAFGAQCIVVAIDANGKPTARAGKSTPTAAHSHGTRRRRLGEGGL